MSQRDIQEEFRDDLRVVDQSHAAAGGGGIYSKHLHNAIRKTAKRIAHSAKRTPGESGFSSRYAPCALLYATLELGAAGGEDPDQIIVKGEKHQEDDQDEADLLSFLHLLDADGSLQNQFQSEEGEIASVKNGDRE